MHRHRSRRRRLPPLPSRLRRRTGVAGSRHLPPAGDVAGPAPPPLPVGRPRAARGADRRLSPAAGCQKASQPPAAPAAKPAATQTAAADAAASPQPSGGVKPGEYMIQIASQPTEEGAKASYRNLAKRFGSVIGGKGFDIQKAEIAGKGVYYRVRIAAGSRQDAITLCQSYKVCRRLLLRDALIADAGMRRL